MTESTRTPIRLALIASAAMLAVMGIASLYAWVVLPGDVRIPTHWGLDGTPDRFGSKLEALLLPLAITAFVTMLFAILPKIEPRRRHLLHSSKAYIAVWIAVLGLFTVLHIANILGALGVGIAVTPVLAVAVAVLFIVLGNFLGKVRSNFFIGIRTPWTLSSDSVWDKTHRLGGRLFVLVGVAGLVVAIAGPAVWALVGLAAGIVGASIFLIAYSFVLWHREQGRQDLG